MEKQQFTLASDCLATIIPAGDEVMLKEGSPMALVQNLGGAVTVQDANGLFRISAENVSKLGPEIEALVQNSLEGEGETDEKSFSDESVWAALRSCYDPEIPVNIVDLGLIYDLKTHELDGGKFNVAVKMTLTAQGCGMGPTIAEDARQKIEANPNVHSAEVDIVWDPPWNPHMMSEAAREKLGL